MFSAMREYAEIVIYKCINEHKIIDLFVINLA